VLKLPQELVAQQKKISKLAASLELDFYDTVFEMVTYKEMNQIAALGGFPVRYPHWRFGMEYDSISKSYEYGLSKIYELVINNDPCYAYLLEGNSFVDHKLVIAHVYGHCDFFKNNKWFSRTNRKMMDQMANHATRVRRYIDLHGIERVERFIDCCLSLENLIDRHSPYVDEHIQIVRTESEEQNKGDKQSSTGANKSAEKESSPKRYLDSYIKGLKTKAPEVEKPIELKRKAQINPEKDILKFLIQHAPLEDWELDIINIIRKEAYYFAPQGMTKIMNEGWASYWHAKMMTEHICNDNEIIDFSDTHSGTMAMKPDGFNPYKIGIELMRDIEIRWNKGQFGKEWSECDNLDAKKNWDRKLDKGREKIFEVRRDYNDVMFIDHFLTEEFCVKNKFFVYQFNKKTKEFEINTRDFKAIKSKLLFQLTNFGQPIIQVVDYNFENRGELLLTHLFEGVELQPDYMKQTMTRLFMFWKRPVSLATVLDKSPALVSYDGTEFVHKNLDQAA
jgi:stage V sporulation protein R